jgi:peptidoglycan hydrolase-like protein with peptidoglycan-binding domain
MAWVVVPNLEELRDQMNKRFPKRDKASDGSIGDTSHKASSSSHNPDKTGNPEHRDGDSKDEVRARDFDADLKDAGGVTMEMVVQHLVKLARAGRLPHLRYIIFNKRIWHKSDGFKTRSYTGKNLHTQHMHVNSDFTQAADSATGVNYHLGELGKPAAPKPPAKPTPPAEKVYKEGDSGAVPRKIQDFFRRNFPGYRNSVSVKRGQVISVDGNFGPQTTAWVKEFQERTGLKQDGEVGPLTFAKMRAYGYQ